MGQKIGAGAVLAIIGITMVVLGVVLLGYSIVEALTPSVGVAGASAIAGGIFVGPAFFWAMITLLMTRKPAPPKKMEIGSAQTGLWTVLFAAIAKETPWIAIAGAGLVAVAEIFLATRRKK
ncbi:MAG: hypothetical protein JO348_12745 [Alphaproteobacteria bacterium]|nr:hypothetical protein [Alphaproteobacteria bacterium]MBV9420632.1 hypothetical protein [Alphaproteobacteria bacterium]